MRKPTLTNKILRGLEAACEGVLADDTGPGTQWADSVDDIVVAAYWVTRMIRYRDAKNMRKKVV